MKQEPEADLAEPKCPIGTCHSIFNACEPQPCVFRKRRARSGVLDFDFRFFAVCRYMGTVDIGTEILFLLLRNNKKKKKMLYFHVTRGWLNPQRKFSRQGALILFMNYLPASAVSVFSFLFFIYLKLAREHGELSGSVTQNILEEYSTPYFYKLDSRVGSGLMFGSRVIIPYKIPHQCQNIFYTRIYG